MSMGIGKGINFENLISMDMDMDMGMAAGITPPAQYRPHAHPYLEAF